MGTVSVRVVALGFIFVVRLRFPSGLSIVDVLRNRYGTDLVKYVRQLEKIDYKYPNCSLTKIFYKLVNTVMSFQSFCNLNWQIETFYRNVRLRLTTPVRNDC